jgi:DNA-binding NtrC family response regulator
LNKMRILVVDDEPTLLMTYRLILEMQGYQSCEAQSVTDAKDRLDSEDIDLLICDLTLGPGETGTDVIEYARTLLPKLPCALLTGYNTQDLENWAREHDVVLLQKPIPIHGLLSAVNRLLDREAQRKTA